MDFHRMIIGNGQIHMDPIKTKAINEWPTQTNLKEVRSSIQFCNFYRDFIPHFASITKAFNVLTEKDHPWEWMEEHERLYDALKTAIREEVVLSFPVEGTGF